MTEVLFYPVAACAVLVIAYAVGSGTVQSQVCAFVAILVAAATRPQAVVFVPVLAAAILFDALCARDGSRLRSFWPTWLVVGGAVLALAAFPSLVGAYAGTLRGGYPLGDGLRLSAEHLSFAALACGLIPFAAVVTLSLQAISGRERDPARARSFRSALRPACCFRYRWAFSQRVTRRTCSVAIWHRCRRSSFSDSHFGFRAARCVDVSVGPLRRLRSCIARLAGAVERAGRADGVCRHLRFADHHPRARRRGHRRGDRLRTRHVGGVRVRHRAGSRSRSQCQSSSFWSRRRPLPRTRWRAQSTPPRSSSGRTEAGSIRPPPATSHTSTRAARLGTSSGRNASGIAVSVGSTRSPRIAYPARSRRPR